MKKKTDNIYKLLDLANDELSKFLCGFIFKNADYLLMNTFIAHKAHESGKNIYIGTGSKQNTTDLAFPILFIAACRLLVQSPNDYIPAIEEIMTNSIFIKDKICYTYSLVNGRPSLTSKIKDGRRCTYFSSNKEILDKYCVADSKFYSENKRYGSLDKYREFYNFLTQSHNKVPSFFANKIMVVCNKTQLLGDLNSSDVYHCLPIASLLTKNSGLQGETLPVDPLVILASNYDAARSYMQIHRSITSFDYLLIVGDSMINRQKSSVKNDHANGLFSQFCMVGNSIIPKDNSMVLWHWDKREELSLLGKFPIESIYAPIDDGGILTQVSKEYFSFLKGIVDEYGTIEQFGLSKYVFRKILYDKLDLSPDLCNQTIDGVVLDIEKALLAENYEKEEIQADIERLRHILYNVQIAKVASPTVFDKIQSYNKHVITLIVHNSTYDQWNQTVIQHGYQNLHLVSFKQFKKLVSKNQISDTCYITFLPTFSQSQWLNELMLEYETKLNYVLYSPEISLLKLHHKKIKKWEKTFSGPKDRKLFPNISLQKRIRESSDDLIDRFEEVFDEEFHEPSITDNDTTGYTYVTLEMKDDENNVVKINSPLKIVKVGEDGIELVSVFDLNEADIVMIYCNKSRESLYEILSSESNKFAEASSDSRLWKNRLREYVEFAVHKEQSNGENDKAGCNEKLLKRAADSAMIKPEYMYRNWILNSDNVLFPQKSKMESLLGFLKDKGKLSVQEADSIRMSRSFFVSVMISLGHNLSAELQSIILNNQGDQATFIDRFVINNSSEYPLLSRFDADTIISIINHNFRKYRFEKLIDQGDCNDEA